MQTGTAHEVNIKHALLGYLPGDKPLVEELGIDFSAIKQNALSVLTMKRSIVKESKSEWKHEGEWKSKEEHADSCELFGPFIVFAVFATILVVRGRVPYSYLYFLSIMCCIFIYSLVYLMNNGYARFIVVVNILGYSFIPTLIFALASAILPVGKVQKIVLGLCFSFWSTFVSATEITRKFRMHNKLVLVAYPILLVYMCFTIIAIV